MSLINRIKSHPRVLALEGREEGFEDWFVELHYGWRWAGDMLPTHCFGAGTLSEAMREIRNAVPCYCEKCRESK
jgi:hypothetical protein